VADLGFCRIAWREVSVGTTVETAKKTLAGALGQVEHEEQLTGIYRLYVDCVDNQVQQFLAHQSSNNETGSGCIVELEGDGDYKIRYTGVGNGEYLRAIGTDKVTVNDCDPGTATIWHFHLDNSGNSDYLISNGSEYLAIEPNNNLGRPRVGEAKLDSTPQSWQVAPYPTPQNRRLLQLHPLGDDNRAHLYGECEQPCGSVCHAYLEEWNSRSSQAGWELCK
jgi:hypothetical protein